MSVNNDEVSWAYLLSPTFQLENTAGKPLTGGYIEVYIHGTRTKYYCASDFDGTLHPFKIPLDSVGSNIVLASPAHSYDIYVYNRFGVLVMSRYNVIPSTAAGSVISDVVNLTSTDDTVSITANQSTDYDLSIADSLATKKDKQTSRSYTGSTTKTITNVSQNANGEVSVTFADINIPANVEITSVDNSISITENTDDNIHTFDLSVNAVTGDYIHIYSEGFAQYAYSTIGASWNIQPVLYKSSVYKFGNLSLNDINTKVLLDKKKKYQCHARICLGVNTNYVTNVKECFYLSAGYGGNTNNTYKHIYFDASYAHTESHDITWICEDATEAYLHFSSISPMSTYMYCFVQEFDVVEFSSVITAGGASYDAGDAISLENDTISVKYGDGLGIDASGNLEVKVGDGLTIDNSGEISVITIDSDVTGVVETVSALKEELDTKLTTNFPYSMITDVNTSIGGSLNGNCLIAQLFSVPLTHKIIANKTYLTVNLKDLGYSQDKVCFGIYEYDFSGNNGTGTTNFVCDTGAVSLAKSALTDKLEFPIIHVNADHNTLKSNCAYYAVMAMPSGHGAGPMLSSAPAYNSSVNSNPRLTWKYENISGLDWSVDADVTLDETMVTWWLSGYNEENTVNRFFISLRNKTDNELEP